MMVTYPPEMLPRPNEGDGVEVIVCCGEKCCAEENRRLQELLRGVGANRYWEGRWRDGAAEVERLTGVCKDKADLLRDAYAGNERRDAENARLQAAMEEIAHPFTDLGRVKGIARRALGGHMQGADKADCCLGLSPEECAQVPGRHCDGDVQDGSGR